MIDTGLNAFGEPAAFFFGDRDRNIGDEPVGAVRSNLVDPTISDRNDGTGVLTVLKEPLIDGAEPIEAGNHPDYDVLVVLGLDRVVEIEELLATGFSFGLTKVDELINILEADVVFREPGIDGLSLVDSLPHKAFFLTLP